MNNRMMSAFTVLFIAWLTYFFSYMSRMSWPPIIPLASSDYGINSAQAGSFMTAFYVGYVITQIPGGFLTDRYGYRKVLLGCFFIIGASTLMTGLVPDFRLGLVARFFAGVGSGAIFSSGLVAITDWFPKNRRGLANGIFMTSTSLGVSVVNLYVPVVANGFGWRATFLVSGILPFLGLLLGYFLLKERTPKAQQPKEQNSSRRFSHDLLSILKNRNLMLVGLSGFCGQWATLGVATWANTYLNKSLHLSLVQAGLFMSVYAIAALLCKPLTGLMSDYVNRKSLTFWILLSIVPILLWFGVNRNLSMLYFLIPTIGVLAYAFYPIMNTIICESIDKKLVGTASGVVNSLWQLGALISPLVVGAVIDATHNFFYVFATLALGPLVGALVILFVKLEKKESTVKPTEQQFSAVKGIS
ncbi:MFS transporter [Fictibacillus terranigra]|uniref:MFS transporter n=1 Tax=Fictibacillus terranigra TaxID=3058424 RepID=A0ABT8EBZ2_9BACL|nr:MFS transporter [Fictibacillus sp. CENA-BCM004]MDN4075411.1 MFS transporter [Fictibacillus sp. CENA-BCM004]